MAFAYDIIHVTEADETVTLKRHSISDSQIPELLNGEAGDHICYVRSLTELIAKQLLRITDRYPLSEEDILAIAEASSLHDIGKTKIAPAILHKACTLTPLEYDMMKKHTVFGGQLLDEYRDQLPPKVYKYAAEIAVHHHERYDGNGYPDGLEGDEIPISAQIVSIADAYEALTADRSYKEALSRDVALEMISNGMSGVFNPLLVECLMQVIDDAQLVNIRNGMMISRTVYSNPDSLPMNKILLAGNLQYVTKDFIENTFPHAHITVIGKCGLEESPNLKIYSDVHRNYKAVLDSYSFDFIVYFANELTYDTLATSDIEELRQMLKACKNAVLDGRFLYLSSLDAAYETQSDRGIIATAKENLCLFWGRENHIDMKIVRIPYLYNGASPEDYLYEVFAAMQTNATVRLRESDIAKTYFLSTGDLSELILHVADAWTSGKGVLTINDEFGISFGQLCRELTALQPGCTFEFTGKNPPKSLNVKNTAIKKQYSWFARFSLLSELEEQYQAFLAVYTPKESPMERFKKKLGSLAHLFKVFELLFFFVVTEGIVYLTDSSLFLSIVDFRMAYVVILGCVWGLPYGLSAAALSSFAWAVSKLMTGTSWMTLFYEPTNWLPFIYYFLVGAVCGYIKLKKDDRIKTIESENQLLEEKLLYTRRVYEDTYQEKRDLKKQIISSKDSFGKIFDITRQLDTVATSELYLKIVNSFENVLENHSLCVYSCSGQNNFARLEVASRDYIDKVARSISLDNYAPVMEQLQKGEPWRNKEMLPDQPMFACGIYRDNTPFLMVFLWEAEMHQRSLYYVNLFRILCDLAQNSLIRASNYSSTLYDQQHIAGTRIQNEEAFAQNLTHFRELAERKVFRYLLLDIAPNGKTLPEMDALLSKCIRANDIIGLSAKGNISVLLSQAGPGDWQFILPRFQRNGMEVVESSGVTIHLQIKKPETEGSGPNAVV